MGFGSREHRRAAVNGAFVARVLVSICFRGFDLVKVILFVLFKVILKCMALSVLAGLVCLPEGPVVILYTFYV